MASPVDSGSKLHPYNRKEKSLGVLCTNFLKLYDRDGTEPIELDEAAMQLGVERRRMYDVVNILECIGVVAKKAKNQYSWKGFGEIPTALEGLQEVGFREKLNTSGRATVARDVSDTESGGSSIITQVEAQESSTSRTDCRREKSLAQLTDNFLKLFLCSDVDLITFENVAMALLGYAHNSTAMRTKVRRLYDIANVLSSINLIEKCHHPDSRKQAFKWLGWRGVLKPEPLTTLLPHEPKKRIFGTDITNNDWKRMKMDSSVEQNSNKNENLLTQSKDQCLENVQEQQLKRSIKCFVFGPFSPVGVLRLGNSGNKNERQPKDFENLASTFRPQYHNEVLSGLFGHYMEAWKSWYTEADEKKEVSQCFDVLHRTKYSC